MDLWPLLANSPASPASAFLLFPRDAGLRARAPPRRQRAHVDGAELLLGGGQVLGRQAQAGRRVPGPRLKQA